MTRLDDNLLRRYKPERLMPSILGIGLDERTQRDALDFDSCVLRVPGEVLQRLGVIHFDLLVAGPALCDDVLAELAQQLDRQFPFQRWAIVACELEQERERFLRRLGSLGVFDDLFTCLHFACRPVHQGLSPPPDLSVG
jgi:hypothetical protein